MSMKLMIVDDHDGMRTMIRQLIAAPSDTVMECRSGDEAVGLLGEFKPDCVTMDVSMPGLCAFKTARAIREAHPTARVIFVSSHDQPDFRRAAERIGPVSERTAAPPVWRNPLRDRIPGAITGPDDLR